MGERGKASVEDFGDWWALCGRERRVMVRKEWELRVSRKGFWRRLSLLGFSFLFFFFCLAAGLCCGFAWGFM